MQPLTTGNSCCMCPGMEWSCAWKRRGSCFSWRTERLRGSPCTSGCQTPRNPCMQPTSMGKWGVWCSFLEKPKREREIEQGTGNRGSWRLHFLKINRSPRPLWWIGMPWSQMECSQMECDPFNACAKIESRESRLCVIHQVLRERACRAVAVSSKAESSRDSILEDRERAMERSACGSWRWNRRLSSECDDSSNCSCDFPCSQTGEWRKWLLKPSN